MKSVLHGRDLIGSPDPLGKTSFVSICSSSQYHFIHINLCCFNFSFDLVIPSACILSSCLIHIYFYICMRVMILLLSQKYLVMLFVCVCGCVYVCCRDRWQQVFLETRYKGGWP